MFITSQTRTLLQIFCDFLLYSKDIFKNMRVADTFYRNSKCEWVKLHVQPELYQRVHKFSSHAKKDNFLCILH